MGGATAAAGVVSDGAAAGGADGGAADAVAAGGAAAGGAGSGAGSSTLEGDVPARASCPAPDGDVSVAGALLGPASSLREALASDPGPSPTAPSAVSTRATRSSSCSRGEVAPVIWSSAALTRSAARDRRAVPYAAACVCIRASSSAGRPRRTDAASSPVAAITMRSRMRSSRSSTKRRGSWPVCTTRSTAANAPDGCAEANASTTSSSSSPWVYPSSATARSYETDASSDPAISWSRIDSVSRGEPAPARTTSGSTPGSGAMLSCPHSCST